MIKWARWSRDSSWAHQSLIMDFDKFASLKYKPSFCQTMNLWCDLIHADQREEWVRDIRNNLFDVTLTGEKNYCFRPKTMTTTHIRHMSPAKKINSNNNNMSIVEESRSLIDGYLHLSIETHLFSSSNVCCPINRNCLRLLRCLF